MINFHELEFVDRGSETQLQVGEKIYGYRVNYWKLFIQVMFELPITSD